jgi:hypothetical protein
MDDASARAVLGVEADASPDAVRAAYRRLLRRHHPDVAGSSVDATRRTAELNRAYAVVVHAPPPPADRPPSPPPPSTAPRPPFDVADDADGVIALDTARGGPAPLDLFNRLCEAADTIGSLSYVDRANTILETIISPSEGPTCSLLVTLEERGSETLAYCTLEPLDSRPGPPIQEVVDALTRELQRLGP